MVFCEKCGKPMNNDDAFCAYCGAPAVGKALQTVGARKPVPSGKMVDKDGNELIKYSYSESDDFEDYENDDEDEDDEDEFESNYIKKTVYDGELDAKLMEKYKSMSNIISGTIVTISSVLSTIIGSAEPEIAYPGIVLLHLLRAFESQYYSVLNNAIWDKGKLQDSTFLEISSFSSALDKIMPSLMDLDAKGKYMDAYDLREKAEIAEQMAYDAGNACDQIIDDIENDEEIFVTDIECNKIRSNLVRTRLVVDNYASEMRSLLRKYKIKDPWNAQNSVDTVWESAHAVQSICKCYVKLRHFEEE